MIPPIVYLYPQNTQVVQMFGLQDAFSLSYVNGALVTAILMDPNGNQEPTFGSLTLTYVGASNGNYQGVLASTFNAPIGPNYSLQITAVASGTQAVFTLPVIVEYRTQ